MTGRLARCALATTAVAGALIIGSSIPAAATSSVIDAAPGIVAIEAPAPGHRTTWSMSVTNETDRELPVGLVVEGAEGLLTTGPAPLEIHVADSLGDAVIDTVPAGELLGALIELEPLAPGESRTLDGEASLPREADDRYQGADGRLTFRFTATVDQAAPTARSLSRTGADAAVWFGLAGASLALGTGLAVIARRRRRRHV